MRLPRTKRQRSEVKEVLLPEERERRIQKLVDHGFIYPNDGVEASPEEARELAEALVDRDERRFTRLYLRHELLFWPAKIWGDR